MTIEDALKRATSLDTKLQAQVDGFHLPPAHKVFSGIRAYLIRRADEMSATNNPWNLLKSKEVTNGIWLITLGPTIDKGPTPGHFIFDSGARLSFGLTLRDHEHGTRLVSFRYQYQRPDGTSPNFLRFDLNPAAHGNPLAEPLCHLHPSLLSVLAVVGAGLSPPSSSFASPGLVISNGAGRRFFFRIRSCECVGLRREKSLFLFRLCGYRETLSKVAA